MRSSLSTPLCLAFGLLSLSGCDKVIEMIKGGAESVAGDEGPGLVGGPKTEDDHLAEKLDPYIDCINSFSRSIHDTADRYVSWANPETGPSGEEKNVYGLYEVTDPQTCVDGVKTAADTDPDDPELEKAGQAFADAVVAAREVVNDAHKYYDEEDYKDDKFAKGKELHPKLMAAFDAFDKADVALRDLVSVQNDALQERDLTRIETEMGKNLMWHNKNVMIIAKRLMREGDVKYAPEFELDLAKFEPVVDEFSAAVEAAEKYADANKEEANSVTMFSSFLGDAGELKKVAKEMLRRKRDNKAFTDDELERIATGPADWVEGSPAKLSKLYNDLVSSSNRLNWHFYKPAGQQ